jgi:hypothetical protein
MGRFITFSLLALMVFAFGCASESRAVFYFGGGKGIRVAIRTEGNRVVRAKVFARLYCVDEYGRRSFNRFKQEYASPRFPLRIDSSGGFRYIDRPPIQEESQTILEALIGHVGRSFVKGRYERYWSQSFRKVWSKCQTNSFPFGESEVFFRARRVHHAESSTTPMQSLSPW